VNCPLPYYFLWTLHIITKLGAPACQLWQPECPLGQFESLHGNGVGGAAGRSNVKSESVPGTNHGHIIEAGITGKRQQAELKAQAAEGPSPT